MGGWDLSAHYVYIIVNFIATVKFALNCQNVNHPMRVLFLINLINSLTFAYLGGLKHINFFDQEFEAVDNQ